MSSSRVAHPHRALRDRHGCGSIAVTARNARKMWGRGDKCPLRPDSSLNTDLHFSKRGCKYIKCFGLIPVFVRERAHNSNLVRYVHAVDQDRLTSDAEGQLMTDEEIVAHILATRVPALWWHRTRPTLGRDDVTSYLGGLPRLAPNLEWPRSGPANRALPLGAQIDCSQIPQFDGGDSLPRTGTLYFFVNVHVEDPHADIWGRVLYSPRLTPSVGLQRYCMIHGRANTTYRTGRSAGQLPLPINPN